MLEHEIEYAKMSEHEDKLWWYQNLHLLVIDHIKKLSDGNKHIRILDAACGTGGLMIKLKALGFTNVFGFDLSEHAIAFCKGKGLEVRQMNLKDISQWQDVPRFDIVVCNDALYFLSFDEKRKFFLDLNHIIAPFGHFLANEPALDMFRGTHDDCVGISKRVNQDLVHQSVQGTSLKILRMTFWPFLLSPIIYTVRLKQRIQIKNGHFESNKMESDVSMPHPLLNWILFIITRLENVILPWKPLGSSLFWVGQITAGPLPEQTYMRPTSPDP